MSNDLNAFEKFNLPLILNIDLEDLEKRYFQAQHLYHPDRLKTQGNQQESTLFNEAYHLLKDPFKRADHLLKCLGWLNSESSSAHPQDSEMLIFMMSLNEKIERASTPEERQNLTSFLQHEIKKNWTELEASLEKVDKTASLSLLNRLKYLHRLKQNLK